MAWKITNRLTQSVDGDVPQVVIVCDAAADVSDLPTTYAPGSIALVADEGLPLYVLNASGTWADTSTT